MMPTSFPALPAAPPPSSLAAAPPAPSEIVLGLLSFYNKSIWPVQIAGVILTFAAFVAVAARPGVIADVIAKIALDLTWLWTGVMFFFLGIGDKFQEGYLFGTLFILQGTFLLTDCFYGTVAFRPANGRWRFVLGLALAAVAVVGEPLVGHYLGRPWPLAELVGTAPGPTAAFTAAILLTSAHRPKPLFMFIPVTWAVVAGVRAATAWGWYETLIPAAVGAVAALAFAASYFGNKSAAASGEGDPV